MSLRSSYLSFLLLISLGIVYTPAEENWPHWRGPDHNGKSSAVNLPSEWSEDKNIVWKTALPSWSAATPIIWEDQIFITSPTKIESENDQKPGQSGEIRFRNPARQPGGADLLLICISKKDGSFLWQREIENQNQFYRKQNSASPSPVTDGRYVWVMTGTGVITALDMQGRIIWKKNLQQEYGNFGQKFGYASSPILYEGKLILQVVHGFNTDQPSYIVALDRQTGEELWRQTRPSTAEEESLDAYNTPLLLPVEGKTQIIVSGGDVVTGHEMATGRELWRVKGLNPRNRKNYRIIASPIYMDGMIYVPTRQTPLLALKVNPTGILTENDIVWKWEGYAAPDVPTPVCDGKYFYMVDDNSRVTCLNAKNGQVIWGPENIISGIVSSSPLLADGKLYITNEKAVTTVLLAGGEFKILSTNKLDDSYTLSSLAVSNHQLFLRTATHLYCIGEKDK
jgi:outer membrane protein assembly factor BamB